MEDPVTFDCWAKVVDTPPVGAADWLQVLRPHLSRRDAKIGITRAHAYETSLLIAEHLTWDRMCTLRDALPRWLGEARVFQHRYSPSSPPANFCTTHHVHYAGCLGCHVCSGFIAR